MDIQQDAEHKALCEDTVLIPCLLSGIHTPKPITMTFPSLMSFLVMSQVYLTLLLIKNKNNNKKKFNGSWTSILPSRLSFPCVLQYYLRNNIEGTIPVTVSWRERAWGPPSVCSKHGDRTFQRHDPDPAVPYKEVAIRKHFIPGKRTEI